MPVHSTPFASSVLRVSPAQRETPCAHHEKAGRYGCEAAVASPDVFPVGKFDHRAEHSEDYEQDPKEERHTTHAYPSAGSASRFKCRLTARQLGDNTAMPCAFAPLANRLS